MSEGEQKYSNGVEGKRRQQMAHGQFEMENKEMNDFSWFSVELK